MPPSARTVTGVLAWLGAAAAATGVGLAAVGAIGVGIVGGGEVLSPAEVDARLAAASAAPAPPAIPPTPPTSAPTSDPGPAAARPKAFPTDGGTVVARCAGGVVEIVSASPAQGWRIHDEAEEDRGRVRFEAGGDRIELRFSCRGDEPVAQTRG